MKKLVWPVASVYELRLRVVMQVIGLMKKNPFQTQKIILIYSLQVNHEGLSQNSQEKQK